MSDNSYSIQEIPTDFPTIPLKYGVDRRTNKFAKIPEEIPQITLSMVESWTGEVNNDDQNSDNTSSGLVEFKEGDVLFNKLRPYLAKAFNPEYNGAASPEFLVFNPNKFKPRYLLYLLLSKEFVDRVNSSTYGAKMPRASWDFIGNLQVPCPNKGKQEQISDYLDQKTTDIDTLLDNNNLLVTYLEEKRRATITHFVTGRHISQTERRNCDIPWLNTIPEHWDVIPIKFLADVQTGIAKGRSYERDDLREVPYLRVANVQDGYLDLENVKTLEITEEEVERYALQNGDVLMNEGGDYDKLGRGTVWEGQINPCVHQNHVFCVRPNERENSEWISLLTQSDYLKHYFMMNAKQTTNLASISASNVSKAPIVWPPKEERTEILSDINKNLRKIKKTRNYVENLTEALIEKRQSLVTQAVTGQIDLTD